jgi:hypothetical protein
MFGGIEGVAGRRDVAGSKEPRGARDVVIDAFWEEIIQCKVHIDG